MTSLSRRPQRLARLRGRAAPTGSRGRGTGASPGIGATARRLAAAVVVVAALLSPLGPAVLPEPAERLLTPPAAAQTPTAGGVVAGTPVDCKEPPGTAAPDPTKPWDNTTGQSWIPHPREPSLCLSQLPKCPLSPLIPRTGDTGVSPQRVHRLMQPTASSADVCEDGVISAAENNAAYAQECENGNTAIKPGMLGMYWQCNLEDDVLYERCVQRFRVVRSGGPPYDPPAYTGRVELHPEPEDDDPDPNMDERYDYSDAPTAQSDAYKAYLAKALTDGGSCRVLMLADCPAGWAQALEPVDSDKPCERYKRRDWECPAGQHKRNEFNTCYRPASANPSPSGGHPACRHSRPPGLTRSACEAYVSARSLPGEAADTRQELLDPGETCDTYVTAEHEYGTASEPYQKWRDNSRVEFDHRLEGWWNLHWCFFDLRWLTPECFNGRLDDCGVSGVGTGFETGFCLIRASEIGGCAAVARTLQCRALQYSLADPPDLPDPANPGSLLTEEQAKQQILDDLRKAGCNSPCVQLPFSAPVDCPSEAPSPMPGRSAPASGLEDELEHALYLHLWQDVYGQAGELDGKGVCFDQPTSYRTSRLGVNVNNRLLELRDRSPYVSGWEKPSETSRFKAGYGQYCAPGRDEPRATVRNRVGLGWHTQWDGDTPGGVTLPEQVTNCLPPVRGTVGKVGYTHSSGLAVVGSTLSIEIDGLPAGTRSYENKDGAYRLSFFSQGVGDGSSGPSPNNLNYQIGLLNPNHGRYSVKPYMFTPAWPTPPASAIVWPAEINSATSMNQTPITWRADNLGTEGDVEWYCELQGRPLVALLTQTWPHEGDSWDTSSFGQVKICAYSSGGYECELKPRESGYLLVRIATIWQVLARSAGTLNPKDPNQIPSNIRDDLDKALRNASQIDPSKNPHPVNLVCTAGNSNSINPPAGGNGHDPDLVVGRSYFEERDIDCIVNRLQSTIFADQTKYQRTFIPGNNQIPHFSASDLNEAGFKTEKRKVKDNGGMEHNIDVPVGILLDVDSNGNLIHEIDTECPTIDLRSPCFEPQWVSGYTLSDAVTIPVYSSRVATR